MTLWLDFAYQIFCVIHFCLMFSVICEVCSIQIETNCVPSSLSSFCRTRQLTNKVKYFNARSAHHIYRYWRFFLSWKKKVCNTWYFALKQLLFQHKIYSVIVVEFLFTAVCSASAQTNKTVASVKYFLHLNPFLCSTILPLRSLT